MPLTNASQFQLGAASPITGLPLYDLFLYDKEKIKGIREKAFNYFLSKDDKCTQADRGEGVRVYIDKDLSPVYKQTIKDSCNRRQGYNIPVSQRYLVRSRVIASACHFVADASGNFFPESPVPAIMLTAPSPNLDGSTSTDIEKFCPKGNKGYILREASYKNEMIKVWTRFLYAANEEAKSKGIEVEVLAPLIGGGAYLGLLSSEDKIKARMIIAEALIEAANQGGFDNIKTIHFFIIQKNNDETYSKVESIFKQQKNKNYHGMPINLASGDILKAGQILVGQGRKIVLCNPGSDHVPGGGAYKKKHYPGKAERGEFYGEINALEELFADYSNFLLMQNLEQNPNENVNNFESLCREIPLPLRFKGLKYLGDKTKDLMNRKDANGTHCYELICQPQDKVEIEALLREGEITILKNKSDCRIKYSKTARDGRDAEQLAKEILGCKEAAGAFNSMLFPWTTTMGPNNATTPEATSSQQVISQGTSSSIAPPIFDDLCFEQNDASPAIPLSSTRRDESPKPANQCQSKKELLANVNAADELGILLSSFKIEEFTIFSLDIKERLCKLALKASTLGGILFCLKEDQITALCLTLKYELNNWVKSPDDLFRCICNLDSDKITAFCMAFSKEDFLSLYRNFPNSIGFELLDEDQQRMLLKVVEIKLAVLDGVFPQASAAPSNSEVSSGVARLGPRAPASAVPSNSEVSWDVARLGPRAPASAAPSNSEVSWVPARLEPIAQASAAPSNSEVSIPKTLSFYYTAPAKKDSACGSSLILKNFQI